MMEIQLYDFSLKREQEQQLASFFHGDTLDYRISYTSDFRSAKPLRELTDLLCKNFGIIPKWRTRIVLILDELHNNAIEYGSQEGDINIFSLKIVKTPKGEFVVEASVSDTGRGQKAKKAYQMEEIRKLHEHEDFSHHTSIRGRGLFLIISHLVDSLSFEDDSTTGGLRVTILKHLSLNS